MNDDALLWNATRPAPRQARPGERLWRIEKVGGAISCELRDHGEAVGCEVQLLRDASCGRRLL